MGSAAFWGRAAADIAAARDRVLIQAMTFEGDAAGAAAAQAVAAASAPDRRVLVDDYVRYVINDRWLRSAAARADAALMAEADATGRLFRDLRAQGVGVRVTNPIGGRIWRYPARNHKKLVLADDVAYLGGVNFSDHNFAWTDAMLRIADADVAQFLAEDFDATYASRPRAAARRIGPISLYAWDGRANHRWMRPLVDRIAAAREAITVVSPYLTFPLTGRLAEAARRGVKVELITPHDNNKPILREAMLGVAKSAGFQVYQTPGMSHLKGLSIDGETVVLGSANFDFASLWAEEEYVAIIDDAPLARSFETLVAAPQRALAEGAAADWPAPLRSLISGAALRIATLGPLFARGSPRAAVDWV